MITFVCIICRIEQPRSMGKPVSDRQYPSWRCADIEACGRRFLASVSSKCGPIGTVQVIREGSGNEGL